jgi:predicted aspartyl protease
MTLETRFDIRRSLICVDGFLEGPRRNARLRLVLDTGASTTLIVPGVIDGLGYSPRDGIVTTSVSSPLGRESGYLLPVLRFGALGFAVRNFRVNVLDLQDGDGFHGLVGLNFLRMFNYEVHSAEGRILVSNLVPLAS